MRIREATVDDAAAIARVHVDAWRTTYPGIVPDTYLARLSYEKRARNWRDILSGVIEPQFVYVAQDVTGNIVGFASGGQERQGDPHYKGELYGIYLLVGHQRQGIGRQLVQTVARRLGQQGFHAMLIWVLRDNPSRTFYEALGGKPVYEKPITIGETTLIEVAYGWPDLQTLTEP